MNVWKIWIQWLSPVKLYVCPDYPDPVDPGDASRDILDAKIDRAPDIYAAESSQAYGQPAYARLFKEILNESLYGKGESLDLMDLGKKVAADVAEQNRISLDAQRENELRNVQELAPEYMQAIAEANPELAELRSAVTAKAQEGLERTYDTTPSEEGMRNARQVARQGYADRGMLRSNPSVASEVLNTERYGHYLQDRARNFQEQDFRNAFGATQLAAATSQDPLLAVLGRPGYNIANNAQMLNQAGATVGGGPGQFNAFGQDYNTYMGHLTANQQGQYQSNLYGANMINQLTGVGDAKNIFNWF